ncbi:hypothetical protein BJV82DRAFT_667716 [Fennellomyces sp. T-0311]|nr:hypothetical protein BJV82DRAFT_667716 [Fennellomyces sp. T-0311]
MSKAHNPPDHDEAPPPPYAESENTAYNPAFMNSPDQQSSTLTRPYSPHSSAADASPFIPSAPPLSGQASTGLYPEAPPPPDPQYYQQQQYHQQQYHQQQYHQHQYYHQQATQANPPIRYQYQSINMPQQPVIRRRMVDSSERGFPIAALFFLFGWFCPPLWVLGACCCSASRNRYEIWWSKVNFIMVVMFIISSIVYSMIAITVGDWMVGMRLLNFSIE